MRHPSNFPRENRPNIELPNTRVVRRYNNSNKGGYGKTPKKMLNTRETSGSRIQSERETIRIFLRETSWLGQEINEHGLKLNKKISAILQLKPPTSSKE